MTIKKLLMAVAVSILALTSAATTPDWQSQVDQYIAQGEFTRAEKLMKALPKKVRQVDAVRIDSLRTIMARIRTDFRMTPEEGVKLIKEKMPEMTDTQIQHWKDSRALEVMTIDGKEMWFRKSVRNLWLLGKEFAQQNAEDSYESFLTRRKYYFEAMRTPADENGVRDWRHVNITFTLDVKADAIPAGETLRVWMPFPYENLRQKNI